MIAGRVARTLRQRGYEPPKAIGDKRTTPLESFYDPRGVLAGESVTVDRALGIGTVYACIRILAETVGSTPLHAFRKSRSNDDRTRAVNTPAYHLLHEEPNPAMSPVDLWTLMATWVVAYGDAFLGKQFASNGELVALWPIHPDRVSVGIVNGERLFEVAPPPGQAGVPARHDSTTVIQVMGQSFTGVRGASPLTIARNELAGALAAQTLVSSVYRNSAVPRGVLQSKKELSDDAIQTLRADWNRIYGGQGNAGKVAILEEDMTFQPVSMPMRDVQFVEQMQLSVQTIARIFRVPLSMIQADSPGGLTYRTAETENLQFLTHGVRPWYVRFEQALGRDADLFPLKPIEYPEFLTEALLRATTKERFDAYAIATGNKAWMKPSEVRPRENLSEDTSLDAVPAAKAAPSPAEPVEEPAA